MKKISTAAVAALMAGASLTTPMTALAADNPTITYGSAVSDDKGVATADTEVVYSTLAGPWKDGPEADVPKEDTPDTSEHAYDTFKIVVPSHIVYSGVGMGKVDIKDNFKIRVVGNIVPSKYIKVGHSEDTGATFNLTPLQTIQNNSSLRCTFYQNKDQATPYEEVDSNKAVRITSEEAGFDPSNDNTPSGAVVDNSFRIQGNMWDRATFSGHFTYSAKLGENFMN